MQIVIQEGEPGSDFFIIEEGTAAATKAGVEGEVSRRLTVGDYFGERALLTNEVRPPALVVPCVPCVRHACRRSGVCCGAGQGLASWTPTPTHHPHPH